MGSVYLWPWHARLPERFGERFRVIARGTLNSMLIEFEADAWRVVTSRIAMTPRRVKYATTRRRALT